MKTNNPLISIIVPNYNHEKYLKQRLECIFNQSYFNFEVILLDDCSLDKSQEILLEYGKNPKVSHCVFNEVSNGKFFEPDGIEKFIPQSIDIFLRGIENHE